LLLSLKIILLESFLTKEMKIYRILKMMNLTTTRLVLPSSLKILSLETFQTKEMMKTYWILEMMNLMMTRITTKFPKYFLIQMTKMMKIMVPFKIYRRKWKLYMQQENNKNLRKLFNDLKTT